MKNYKKIVVLAASTLLLSACNGGASETTTTSEPTTTTTTTTTETPVSGFNVVFITNGGTSVAALKNVTSIATAPVTTRHGYIFTGWFTSNESATPVTFPLSIVKDTVLYAKWDSIFTDATMSEDYWTETVKTNNVNLVGFKKGDNLDDFNYSKLYATRDDEGIYVYVKERVTGTLLDNPEGDWWENNNFELRFNQSGEWDDVQQLYLSTLNGGTTNFDVMACDIHEKLSGYDCWTPIEYKAFVSYETLSLIDASSTYNKDSNIYVWYGSASGHGFDHSESWEDLADVKITKDGIVNRDNETYATSYEHNHVGWDNTSEWATIGESLAVPTQENPQHYYQAIHLNGALGANTGNIGDIVWRTSLLVMSDEAKSKGSFFRLDWCHFDFGGFTPSAYENGAIWEYDSLTEDDQFKYYVTVNNCDVVYKVERINATQYKMCTCLFPEEDVKVGRGDYVLRQSITTDTQLSAFISAEFSNFLVYGK